MENLTIIVPFWHGHKYYDRLLNSLPAGIPIIVVNDYGSREPMVHAKNPQIISLSERGYFSGACNVGFAACDTDVLILNQDLYFTSDEWLKVIEQYRDYGTVGHAVMGHPAWPAGYVQGTFMYMSRAALNAVGGFAVELYPLWGATAEWQLRACRAGFEAMPLRHIPGMGHEHRKRYGASIEKALDQEPERKAEFIRTPPEISVIVPCYNYGHYLPACIDSLMAQTMQSFEVIIVDDKSTDDSLKIASDLQSFQKGVRVLWHTENRGTATAINTGIKHAHGKYITIVSADDTLEQYSLERHYQGCLNNPHAFTYGDLFFKKGDEQKTVKMQKFNYSQLIYRNHVPAGIMYPKQAWVDVGGYPEIMNDGREDWAFAIGLGRACYCGVHIGQTGYNARREGQNRSLTNSGKHGYFLNKIMSVYPDVYKEGYMTCCGRGRNKAATVAPTNPVVTTSKVAPSLVVGGVTYIELEYTGAQIGNQVLWCPSGRKYKYGRNARRIRFSVHPKDLAFVMSLGEFKKVTPKPAPKPVEVKEVKAAPAPEPVKEPEPVAIEPKPQVEVVESSVTDEIDATNGALKLADESGIDLAFVKGTGKDGRITKPDVQNYLANFV